MIEHSGRRRPLAASRSTFHPVVGLFVAAITSLVLGGVTSFAQGFLPEALAPFANSASGWTVLTVLIVWLLRGGTRASAVFGLASFDALVLGYTLVSEFRGLFYNPLLFGVAGAVAGPFVGVAATWLRSAGRRPALGAGLLCGIAIGEGVWGLLHVADTTGWFYWVLIGVVGMVVLAATLRSRADSGTTVLLGVAAASVVAVAFYGGYTALGLL